MNKYILINQEAKGVLQADRIVGLIGTHALIDYDVELVGAIPSFRTYLLDDFQSTGALNVNLVLSSGLAADKGKAKKLFLDYFQKAFQSLGASNTATVVFYPPTGISIGTVSG
jgi:hypothetical protein